MKVLLVNPANVGKFGLQNVFQAEPLGLELIAAALKDDHDVRVQDLRWEPGFESRLASFSPDLVGISCLYTSHVGSTWELAERVKRWNPSATVVVGGQPPTLAPELFASPHVDQVVLGDGEKVMPELCRALESGEGLDAIEDLVINGGPTGQSTPRRSTKPKDLASVPRPWRAVPGIDRGKHYLAFTRPIALVEINRGCPFDCDFCSIWKMGEGRLRSRQVDEAVAELASVAERDVFFTDDHFFANPKLMNELGQAIVAADLDKHFKVQSRSDVFIKHPELIDTWAKAGLKQVFLGLEGHSDARLEDVRKRTDANANETAIERLTAAGIGVVGNLMVDPTFTREEFQQLRDYVADKELAAAAYCVATPFPGTDLWERRKGSITSWDFELYDIQHAVTETTLPLPEFYEEYTECWKARAELQPPDPLSAKLRRIGQMVFRDGINFELLKNVRRFDRDVARPEAYLEDHAAERPSPWASARVA
ncbi:MAG: radical SAM protein [Acidobacteriota bacterium]